MRKLLITLLSMLVLMPASALALGLGNVTLHSALNEPLHADIVLLSASPAELESLRVGLADIQTFARLGVERNLQLLQLRFEVTRNAAGDAVIRVTSRDNMREPFVTFLLEAQWQNGRLVREYTLLLDPPLTHAERTPAPVAPVTTPRPVSTPVVPSAPPAAVVTPVDDAIVYGPVQRDDTLWRIASQLRPGDDISVQQMMMALLRANPYAFIDGNINRLKAGYVLRIDDPALLRAMSREEAAREVTRQTRDWEQRRDALAARAGERVTPDTTAAAPSAVAVAPVSEPELKLVTPEGRDESPLGADVDSQTVAAVRQDLMLALESASVQQQENEELRKRIQTMESQLADMERILSLKSTDLASLQQQLGEQPASPAEPAPRPERPRPASTPQPEPSMLDKLLADPLMLGVGGGLLVLFLLLFAILLRRRRKSSFQESILGGSTSSMMSGKAGESKETSFLSDLAISGMGGPAAGGDDGQVDPLTEADVFMAYGRNKQAEEVLRKALDENPNRPELLAKMLELYYNIQDRKAFESLVEDAADKLKTKDELWAKVAAMGRELLPAHALFANSELGDAPVPEKSAPITDDVLDIGLDLDELTAEMESEAEGLFDLSDLELDLNTLGELEKKPDQNKGEAINEFELDLGETVAESGEAQDAILEQAEGLQDDGFELDFQLEAEPEISSTDVGKTLAASDDKLNLEQESLAEASELDAELVLDEAEPEPEPEPITELESTADDNIAAEDELKLDDEPTLDDELDLDVSSELEDLDDLDDLGELDDLDEGLGNDDEMITKLDLAQAYIEMGDSDGAKGMLEEVLQAGNAEQQKQAQELLDKI